MFEGPGERLRLWLPDDAGSSLRGIMFIGNGSGYDQRNDAESERYQTVARRHHLALIASNALDNFEKDAEWLQFLGDVEQLASMAQHPELNHAPFIPLGFSNGGQQSYAFAFRVPERTVLFVTAKGCCYIGGPEGAPPAATLSVPGLLIAGMDDTDTRRNNIRTLFEHQRAQGALWAWFEQFGSAHDWTDTIDQMTLAFADEMLRLRYPEGAAPTATTGVTLTPLHANDGWLVGKDWNSGFTTISGAREFSGDPLTMGWVANERVANLYRAVASYDPSGPKPGGKFFGVATPEFASSYLAPGSIPVSFQMVGQQSWAELEVFDWAHSIGVLAADRGLLPVNLFATGAAGHLLHGVVRYTDGQKRTTDIRYVSVEGDTIEQPLDDAPHGEASAGAAGGITAGGGTSGGGGGAALDGSRHESSRGGGCAVAPGARPATSFLVFVLGIVFSSKLRRRARERERIPGRDFARS